MPLTCTCLTNHGIAGLAAAVEAAGIVVTVFTGSVTSVEVDV